MCCAARKCCCLVLVLFLAAAPRAGVACIARSIVAGLLFLFCFLRRAQGVAAPRAELG
ncbi:hypothetical protein A2U01_0083187 [Trifolium medium]|uniref:Uncharacterized protein n=1 Tax=Trifolium medium TaxID=97028 RepID=A0A392TP36_9FABA|nr:hypothetical protein [Trifolium medium]